MLVHIWVCPKYIKIFTDRPTDNIKLLNVGKTGDLFTTYDYQYRMRCCLSYFLQHPASFHDIPYVYTLFHAIGI